MSNLASKLAQIDDTDTAPQRRGPTSECFRVYGPGDVDDWAEVHRLKSLKTWSEVQAIVDEAAGIDRRLPLEKFKYHWRQRCFCWRGTAA